MNCDSVIHGRISVYIRIDACIAFANCRQISVAINFDHIGIAGAPTDVAITRITAIEARRYPVPLPHGQRIPCDALQIERFPAAGLQFFLQLLPRQSRQSSQLQEHVDAAPEPVCLHVPFFSLLSLFVQIHILNFFLSV